MKNKEFQSCLFSLPLKRHAFLKEYPNQFILHFSKDIFCHLHIVGSCIPVADYLCRQKERFSVSTYSIFDTVLLENIIIINSFQAVSVATSMLNTHPFWLIKTFWDGTCWQISFNFQFSIFSEDGCIAACSWRSRLSELLSVKIHACV